MLAAATWRQWWRINGGVAYKWRNGGIISYLAA